MILVFYTVQNSKLATVEGIHFSSVREKKLRLKLKELLERQVKFYIYTFKQLFKMPSL